MLPSSSFTGMLWVKVPNASRLEEKTLHNRQVPYDIVLIVMVVFGGLWWSLVVFGGLLMVSSGPVVLTRSQLRDINLALLLHDITRLEPLVSYV